MYITNPSSLPSHSTYTCDKSTGEILLHKYKIPIISYSADGMWIFSITEQLQKALEEIYS